MAELQRLTPTDLIPKNGFMIEFPDATPADAERYTRELLEYVNHELGEANIEGLVEPIRTDPNTLDIGTVLSLSSMADVATIAQLVVAVATAIETWRARNNQPSTQIVTPDRIEKIPAGSMVANGESEGVGISRVINRVLDRQSSQILVIILGASKWPLYPALGEKVAFRQSAERFRRYLTKSR